MKTAVIYARYSSDKQTEQSIEGQLRVCHEYAERNDIIVVDTYIDRAMTGTNDNRPDFQRMLKDSKNKKWDYVLVYKLDRFGRNKYEMAINKRFLRDNGVKVISAMENIPDTPEGIILESLLEGMAEYYSVELAQKVNRGIKESWLKGNQPGGRRTLGYNLVNKKLVINEEEAEIVREIFTLYSQGYTTVSIANMLNERDLRKPDGSKFHGVYIGTVLHRKHYTGTIVRQGDVYNNIYPRIISDELWNKVNLINEKNRTFRGMNAGSKGYILAGKSICGYCGCNVIGDCGGRKTNRRNYYLCSNRKRYHNCQHRLIGRDYLEDLVVDITTKLLNNDENIKYIASIMFELCSEKKKSNDNLNNLIRLKKEKEKACENLVSAIEKGIVTETTHSRLLKLETEVKELEVAINNENQKSEVLITEEEIIKYLKNDVFHNCKYSNVRRAIVNTFVNSIILYNDKVIITYKCSEDYKLASFTKEYVEEVEKQCENTVFSLDKDSRISKKSLPILTTVGKTVVFSLLIFSRFTMICVIVAFFNVSRYYKNTLRAIWNKVG